MMMDRVQWAMIVFLTTTTLGCFGPRSQQAPLDPGPRLDIDGPIAHRAPSVEELSQSGPFSRTNSGLKYRVLRESSGRKPRATDRVRVHYHGWLDDGTVFDSSYERGTPTSFGLDQVVSGWTEGLQYVSEGGKIELEIPSNLGYGPRGSGSKIPPNATLHFVVELLAINP